MKKALILLLGFGLLTLGCAATEDGKDGVQDNDTLANDGLGLDGYQPGDDLLADQAGADLLTDLGGWSGDTYSDIPQGLGEVFEEELCRAYCNIAESCSLEHAGETCLADCAAQLALDAGFALKANCLWQAYGKDDGDCQALTVCDDVEVSEGCMELCPRAGECGLFRPPFSNMWGNSVDECNLQCSAAAVAQEGFDEALACFGPALETCNEFDVAVCFGLQDEVCLETCDGQGTWALDCGLVGEGKHFADVNACLNWCNGLDLGNALAAQSCIQEFSDDVFFGFPRDGECASLASAACLAGDLELPLGAEAFAGIFFDLCQENIEEEVELPSVLTWRALGTMLAAGLYEGADFVQALDCAEAYETCPGRHAWLSCFMDDHWDYSQTDCQAIMTCEDQINPEYIMGMTYGDCIFYCDYHKDTFAGMLADMHSCLGTTEGNCAAVEVCIAGPVE
jgi:hypothetical protein